MAGALARDIDIPSKHADIGWTTSRVLDLLPDGSTVGFDADPPEGESSRDRCCATGAHTTTAPKSIP
jgi:hypothetical protein